MKIKLPIISSFIFIFLFLPVCLLAAEQSETGMQSQSSLMNEKVGDLTGKTVSNTQGKELGKIDKVVKDIRDNSLQAVLSIGGFLGIGSKQITIPINELTMDQGKMVWGQAADKDQLKQRAAYQEQEYRNVDKSLTIAQANNPAGTQVSFEALDTNHDGYISPEEAKADPKLAVNFQKADQNSDNQIEQSEFSAFEEMQQQSEPSGEGGM